MVHENSGLELVAIDLSACIANTVYVTVLSTQQATLLYDIDSPHGELETSRHGKTAVQWTYHVQEV